MIASQIFLNSMEKNVNSDKARAKSYINNNIRSHITNLTHASNEIQKTLAALDRTIGRSPSGDDVRLIGDCQKALQELSVALEGLNNCQEHVRQLNTEEQVEGEQY